MSIFSGLSRPMKAAGVALIGVAVIAAVIGVVSLSGGGQNQAGPSSSTSAPAPTTHPASPPPSTPPPSSTTPPPTSTATSPPPSSTPGPSEPGKGDQQASNKWVTVRVFNNSTIKGLAARAADDFRAQGWNVTDVSNYSQGIIPETTAYFRPGTDEEAAAKQLAAEFGLRAEPRFQGIADATPGVIVIVTNNYHAGQKGS
jgi:hypothetical protein